MIESNKLRTKDQDIREKNITFVQTYGTHIQRLFDECFNDQSDHLINKMTAVIIKFASKSNFENIANDKERVKSWLQGVRHQLKHGPIEFDENKPFILFGSDMETTAC